MKQKRNNLFQNKHRLLFIPVILSVILMFSMAGLTGCSEADRVTRNLSTQADNFNVLRQMTGKMSITADVEDNQLEVVVKNDDGSYGKHIIGLSDNVTYVVEDMDTNHVNKCRRRHGHEPCK